MELIVLFVFLTACAFCDLSKAKPTLESLRVSSCSEFFFFKKRDRESPGKMSPPQDDQISPISYLMQNHNKVFFFFFFFAGVGEKILGILTFIFNQS